MKNKNSKILKTVTVLAGALVFSNSSNAWFWDETNDRPMRTTPQGQVVPERQTSWLERATTYHEELKPEYDPARQRVVAPTSPRFDGAHSNTETGSVKPAWYDRMTTYHEEDRRPWNPYDTAEKQVPAYMYYDKKEARDYNEHYSQKGLKPTPYMYGSASLVLRKELNPDEMPLMELDKMKQTAMSENDARMVGMGDIYIRPAGGFDTIDNRGSMNEMQLARTNNIMMADPITADQQVEVYNNVIIGNPKKADVQAKTKIMDANLSWREKLETKPDFSRPGDFDYKPKKEKTAEAFSLANNQGGLNTTQNGGFDNYGEGQVIAGGENNMQFNQQAVMNTEKVDNYLVENGDTLSQVSEKEKVYGDWTLWPLIYDANRNQVKDPDLIYPGQNLDIPRDYDEVEENDARYRSANREHPISLYDGK